MLSITDPDGGGGQELGIEIVAEAVETESDAIELSQLGCDHAQGYLFGEPLTITQARQIITEPASRLKRLEPSSAPLVVASMHGHGSTDEEALSNVRRGQSNGQDRRQ